VEERGAAAAAARLRCMAGMPWRAVGCSWRLLVEVPGSYQESDIEHVEFARCAELIGFDFGNLQQS
tara:strand:+ start:127 stop:324 length:198 start_codon:yes stop_codon:yes gene_type:complete